MTSFSIDILTWSNQLPLLLLQVLIGLAQLLDLLLIKRYLFIFWHQLFFHCFLLCLRLGQALSVGDLIQLTLINSFLLAMNLINMLLLLKSLSKFVNCLFHLVILSFCLSNLQVIVNHLSLCSLTFIGVPRANNMRQRSFGWLFLCWNRRNSTIERHSSYLWMSLWIYDVGF